MGRNVTFPRVRKVRIFKPLQVQFLGHFLRFFPFFLYILPHLLTFILPKQPLPPHLPFKGTQEKGCPLTLGTIFYLRIFNLFRRFFRPLLMIFSCLIHQVFFPYVIFFLHQLFFHQLFPLPHLTIHGVMGKGEDKK